MFDIGRQSRFAFVVAMAMLGWTTVAGPVAAAGDVPASAVELGEAPRRDVPQDTSDWLLQPPTGRAATTRSSVVQLYNNVYVPGSAVALAWTGSIAGCNPGTSNLEHQQAVIARTNYFRALAALPPVSLRSGAATTQGQAAALMMSANNALSHTPPTNWLCYSADGATGASISNLYLGINGVSAIDGYIDDPGASNDAAGHRRWILYPPQGSLATGDVPTSGPLNRLSNALVVIGAFTTRPATPDGIAWPPAGFVPYQNLPSRSNRWSLSYPGADFSNAKIVLSGPGGSIPVTLETVHTGYGDNTVVFQPSGVSYLNPIIDTSYRIVISGVTGSGVPGNFQYTVTVIDPNAIGLPPTLVGVVSRKLHGAAGTFNLPLGGVATNPTTEPRQGTSHLVVFTFDKPVTAGTAQVNEGTAIAAAPTFSGSEMRVPLGGVSDQQYVSIVVSNVNGADGSTGGSGSIRIGFLLGDVNQSRGVSLADLGQVNAQIAKPVTAANYLKDVNASGTLSLADKGITNTQVTSALPAP